MSPSEIEEDRLATEEYETFDSDFYEEEEHTEPYWFNYDYNGVSERDFL